jgi:hypothetical protein
MSRSFESALLLLALSGACMAAPRYDGPRPPQPDLPYLLHANNLVPTEKVTAREESGKNGMSYVINGSSSTARTPLAEPIFIVQAQRMVPDRLGCFRMDVNKSGNREVVMGKKSRKDKPIPLKVTKLEEGLYKVEVDTPLENGQYTLSPEGSDEAFAFEIY